jgi:aldose 1-epimerase
MVKGSGKPSDISFSCTRIQQNGWEEILLCDEISGCRATIIPSAGAALRMLEVAINSHDQEKKWLNVIDGVKDKHDFDVNFTKDGFKGAKLSPFVCRLNKGVYEWNDIKYQVGKSPGSSCFYDDNHHALHGLIFDAPFQINKVGANSQRAECQLFHCYDGVTVDSGYPFAFHINISYILESENKLTITTTVQNCSGTKIPISDGWHPYFQLAESIDSSFLQFQSRKMVEFNSDLLPTGNLLDEAKWNQDEGVSLNNIQLDNCFVLLKEDNWDVDKNRKRLPSCILRDESVGLAVHIYPDVEMYPFLQLYIPPSRKSIAIENLSSVPDAFNNKIGLLELEPEGTKTFTTCYQIVVGGVKDTRLL